MQTVKKFSGSTNAPKKSGAFDFSSVSDGNIYKAVLVDDYASQKGFLVALTRYANGNNLAVTRYAAPDGAYVEFQLTAKPVVETEPSPEGSADESNNEQF